MLFIFYFLRIYQLVFDYQFIIFLSTCATIFFTFIYICSFHWWFHHHFRPTIISSELKDHIILSYGLFLLPRYQNLLSSPHSLTTIVTYCLPLCMVCAWKVTLLSYYHLMVRLKWRTKFDGDFFFRIMRDHIFLRLKIFFFLLHFILIIRIFSKKILFLYSRLVVVARVRSYPLSVSGIRNILLLFVVTSIMYVKQIKTYIYLHNIYRGVNAMQSSFIGITSIVWT